MLRSFVFATIALMSISAIAAPKNDIYGTVNEIIHRTGGEQDGNRVYFRMTLSSDYSSKFEDCYIEGDTITWNLDFSSPVGALQYDMVQKSYINKKPLRVTGKGKMCTEGRGYSDNVFELSPVYW